MNIRVPEELIVLAEIFKKNKEKLYIVGGYIRNQLLGISDKYNIDIDICSSAKPEKVIKFLKDTDFTPAEATEVFDLAARYKATRSVGVIDVLKSQSWGLIFFKKSKV